jgi:archaemetzincin
MFVNRRRAVWIAVSLTVWTAVLYFGILRPVWRRAHGAACELCPPSASLPGREDEAGFTKLGPPRPGEWRWTVQEPAQTFEQYIAGSVNRRCDHRSTFYIQPLGDAGDRYREILERMRTHSQAYFGVPAKILDPIPLPTEALNPERNQDDATKIINVLADRAPADALVYVGITDRDLYSTGLNFVFGEGSLHFRSGVYSLRRFETDDPALFLRRSLKLVSHESGHILSIDHCGFWSCVMQGANSLEEHDRHPLHLCPVDLRKVLWNSGADRDARYRELRSLYEGWGLKPESDWIERRLAVH